MFLFTSNVNENYIVLYHVGHSSSSLVYDSGEITLTYDNGHLCHQKYNRSTVITFVCDQSKTGLAGPTFLNETEDCVYQFVWPTAQACPPFKVADCGLRDPSGGQYDLSSLSLNDDNYQTIDHVAKKKYIFNVCRSLVHQKGGFDVYNNGLQKRWNILIIRVGLNCKSVAVIWRVGRV